MDLSKRLLLLKHIDSFIKEQIEVGTSTRDILGMLNYKSNHYKDKLDSEFMGSVRKMYIENYSLYLMKRVIDFQYFRKKHYFQTISDTEIFKLLNFRDTIIFRKNYKDQ